MRKKLLYIFAGLGIYLAFLVIMLPAEPVLEWAAPRLQEQGVTLGAVGIDGTVWSGEAASVSFNGISLGGTTWELAPLKLLTGRIGGRWMVQPPGGYLSGNATVSSEQVRLSRLDGRLSAARLMAYAPAIPVQLDGEISGRMERIVLSRAKIVEAAGAVIWNQAKVTAPMEMPLGDLRVEVTTAEDGQIVGDVSDAGGPLSISGEAVLAPQGTYRLELDLAARQGASSELKQALDMLGRSGPGGKHRVTYSGRLPL